MSIDHKVDNPAEIRRMKDAGMKLNSGQNRINGLALARTLGDHFIKEKFPGVIADPFVSPVYELGDGDNLLILASDGVSFYFYIYRIMLLKMIRSCGM